MEIKYLHIIGMMPIKSNPINYKIHPNLLPTLTKKLVRKLNITSYN